MKTDTPGTSHHSSKDLADTMRSSDGSASSVAISDDSLHIEGVDQFDGNTPETESIWKLAEDVGGIIFEVSVDAGTWAYTKYVKRRQQRRLASCTRPPPTATLQSPQPPFLYPVQHENKFAVFGGPSTIGCADLFEKQVELAHSAKSCDSTVYHDVEAATRTSSSGDGDSTISGLGFSSVAPRKMDRPRTSRKDHQGKTMKAEQVGDTRKEHLGDSRQYWRDIILGVNDGLVSTFLLVAGVVGAHLSSTDILLTAIAGMIAGAISMSAGEYIATKTQEEVFDGEIKTERDHILNHRELELQELPEFFEKIGIVATSDDDDAEVQDLHIRLLEFYGKRDEAHLAAHVALEFGVLEEEKRDPLVAGGVAFLLFIFGALPSVIPFVVTSNVQVAFSISGLLSTFGLLLVGAVKTWATGGNLWSAAAENLAVSAGGGAIAYAVGYMFEKILREGV